MPIYNKRERVEAIMRYIHNHKYQQNTADTLSRELNIPSATVRKTLNVDYPQCFSRDPNDRRNITLVPFEWPDGRDFDLEPAPEKTKKLSAAHMHDTTMRGIFQTGVLDALDLWADRGIALDKTPDEYWKLWNTLNLALASMQLVKSKDPQDKLRRLFDDTEKLPEDVHNYVKKVEAGLNKHVSTRK